MTGGNDTIASINITTTTATYPSSGSSQPLVLDGWMVAGIFEIQ